MKSAFYKTYGQGNCLGLRGWEWGEGVIPGKAYLFNSSDLRNRSSQSMHENESEFTVQRRSLSCFLCQEGKKQREAGCSEERAMQCLSTSLRHLPWLQIHLKQGRKTATQLAKACLHMGAFNEQHTLFITCLHFKS